MTLAVAARRQGDNFQARQFWLYAAHLLDPAGKVVRVSFERGPKAFDDVVVEYDPALAPRDHFGQPVLREYIQCKWHTKIGDFGYEDLVHPKFIGGKTHSFLRRAREAQLAYAPNGSGCRFKLVTNWSIRRDDPLARLVRTQTHALDIETLLTGKTAASAMGKVRRIWRGHLSIGDDELATLARVIAIATRVESAEDLRDRLDDRFAAVGLKRVPAASTGFLYDDLIGKLHDQRRTQFDRSSFADMCRVEKLLEEPKPPAALTAGVRSRMHPIESLELRSERMLDLVHYFDDRYVRDEADWNARIFPELRAFLIDAARSADRTLRLVMDVHVSLAFAAGSVLNVKTGKRLEIEQRTEGCRFWSADDVPVDPNWPRVSFETEKAGLGDELAVAIGLTHDVGRDVKAFIKRELHGAGTIIHVRPSDGGVSREWVKSGSHAVSLAEQVTARLRDLSGTSVNRSRMHLFMAVPNAFAFFLGQHQPALGPIAVYEFDFEGLRTRSYSLGLLFGR